MSKPVLGLILGGILGVFDGLTALLSAPEVAPQIVGIVIGSTFKGLVVGVLAGWFARKVHSLAAGHPVRPRPRRVLRLSRRRDAAAVGRALLLGDHPAGQRARHHRRLCDAAVWAPGSGALSVCLDPSKFAAIARAHPELSFGTHRSFD